MIILILDHKILQKDKMERKNKENQKRPPAMNGWMPPCSTGSALFGLRSLYSVLYYIFFTMLYYIYLTSNILRIERKAMIG